MAPFDRQYTSSCLRFMVALSFIISELSEILVENRDYFIPHLH